MVFFNCNACGDALKKNQVEKHKYRCRQCQALSCVDCGKDFWGSDYQNHNKCMTENEKYCGKGYVPKVNKGEVKQEQWIEKVQTAIEKASSNIKLRGLLEKLQDYPNIPRKKAKFENFLKNSLRVLSPALISQVWDLLMESANNAPEKKENDHVNTANSQNNSKNSCDSAKNDDQLDENCKENNDQTAKLNKREKKEERQKKQKKEKKDRSNSENMKDNEVVPQKKKRKHDDDIEADQTTSETAVHGKKRKMEEVVDETVGNNHVTSSKKKKKKKENNSQEQAANENHEDTLAELDNELPAQAEKKKKFKWESTITAILQKKGEMSLKKLRRKVLQEFSAQDAANYNEENLIAKFNKKVSKLPQVCVKKERVRLK